MADNIKKSIEISVNADTEELVKLEKALLDAEQASLNLAKAEEALANSAGKSAAEIKQLEINGQKASIALQEANAKVDSIRGSLDNQTGSLNTNKRSLLENGGAMGLLSAATGGLAMDFKDAIEAVQGMGLKLKGLNGVIAGSLIGALAIVVLELINNWDKWSEAITGTNSKLKALNDIQGDLNSKLKETYTQLFTVKSAFDQARDGAISKKDALKIYNDTLGDTLGKAKTLDEAEKIYANKTADYVKATQLRMTAQLLLGKAAEQAAKLATGETADLTFWDKIKVGVSGYLFGAAGAVEKTAEIIGNNTKEAKDSQQTLLKLASDYQEQADELSKASGLNFTKVEEKKTAVLKKQSDDRLAILRKEADEFFRIAKQSYDDYIKIQGEQLKILQENLPVSPEDRMQKKLSSVDNEKLSYEERIKNLQDFRDKVREEEQLTLEQKEYFLKEADAIERKIDGDKKEDKRKSDEEEKEFQIKKDEAITTSKQNMNQIIEGLEQTGLAKSKAGQAAMKTLALAQIGIDSAVALGRATKLANAEGDAAQAAFPTVPGIGAAARIISYVSTAAQVASNVVRAKQLLSSSTANASPANGGGGSPAPQAQFNIVGSSGTNQLAQTIAGAQQQPVQAYVVSTEVTSQQALDRNRVNTATFL